jgi:hypothetical protein
MSKRAIRIKYEYGPCGNCPVQAEGTINGLRFEFRARGQHWSLEITKDKERIVLRERYLGKHYGPTKPEAKFAAGYATPEECKKFIERAAGVIIAREVAKKKEIIGSLRPEKKEQEI